MTKPTNHSSRHDQLRAAMQRLGQVDYEIRRGYQILIKQPRTVSIFGSARTAVDSHYYQQARQLGGLLAQAGYSVVTGGGPGIMEAANRGAFEAGGQSIGFNVTVPHEQSLNQYTTDSFEFTHFAPRKIALTMLAEAYIFFPGGFGTMDELAEILTLTQTDKINRIPIILFDQTFWRGWQQFVTSAMLPQQVISPGDEQLYHITQDLDEIMSLVTATD